MAIAISIKTTKLISVHNEPNALRIELPSLTPGTYFIPGVESPDSEFERCIFTFPNRPPVQYATRKELDGKKYVEIEVFEAKTPQYGTEFIEGLLDEHGKRMSPPLQRALLTVTAEEVANELERQCVYFDQNIGVRALDKDVTVEDIVESQRENTKYMQRNVAETNKWSKHGQLNITEQARAHAWKLHKMGMLTPLPPWATVNPQGGDAHDTQNCENCGAVLGKNVSRCTQPGCGTILNWKLALRRGQVLAKDVPRELREEAGLEDPKTRAEILAETRAQVHKDFNEGTA